MSKHWALRSVLRILSRGMGFKAVLGGLLLALGVLAIGCSQGAYPLDFFYEMHYHQSYRSYEPPRLSIPDTAVPWFPGQKATSNTGGDHLYQVNCSMCHGVAGKGDGPVLQMLVTKYSYKPVVPPDLTSVGVVGMGAAGIRGFMGSGVQVMPNFSKLLSPEETQSIADYVVRCLQGSPPAQCR
ncbi:MAG: cytochrome c [Dehalococcoidia bacterium]|nr:cytochrome c [Dehalococcoidia bacterium]MSQ16594.1 cytochrome c [Dehalococcoidia bacterium]